MKKIVIFLCLICVIFITGCVSSQIGSIEFYDNNIYKTEPHDILSNGLVRIEISQGLSEISDSFSTPETRTIQDRILNAMRINYPETDAVLIASIEAIKKSVTEYFYGSSRSEYVYVIIGYPIKYRNNRQITNLAAGSSAIFPSGFVGTWKRDTYDNTLTFTTNSVKSSARDDFIVIKSVSGNDYILGYSNSERTFTITMRLQNGNIVISGGTGSGQNNWNGTWRKQ